MLRHRLIFGDVILGWGGGESCEVGSTGIFVLQTGSEYVLIFFVPPPPTYLYSVGNLGNLMPVLASNFSVCFLLSLPPSFQS